jgi:hypothetical protein
MSTSKTPVVQPRDWRHRIDYELQQRLRTTEELEALVCPFYLTPDTDAIPNEYTAGLNLLVSGMDNKIPWTGFYAQYKNLPLAVANAYGVWFEISMENGQWQARRPARKSLNLVNWPCDGINLERLYATGHPITRAPSRAPSQAPSIHDSQNADDGLGQTEPLSSRTQRQRQGGRPPRGTGDDPFTMQDIDEPTSTSKSK